MAGGKKKSAKASKISEMQRARQLKLRADHEEESRRQKMQLIALYMKNKLMREEAFSRLNLAKINQDWRSMLRQIKNQELRNELEQIKQHCTVMLEQGQNLIQRLLKDLETAHDMNEMLFQMRLEIMQNVENTREKRVNFYLEHYRQVRLGILSSYEQSGRNLRNLQITAQKQLECVHYELEKRDGEERLQIEQHHFNRLEDMKSEIEMHIERIADQEEKKLEQLWQMYQKMLDDYLQYTKEFYADYLDLKDNDDAHKTQMATYNYEMDKSVNELNDLKLALLREQERHELDLKYLNNQKEHLSGKLQELKKDNVRRQSEETKKIRVMSCESYKQIEKFKKCHEKLKNLYQLAKICQKYENEEDYLFLFNMKQLTKVEENNKDRMEIFTMKESENFSEMITFKEYSELFHLMKLFWKRLNHVKVDAIYLEQRKQTLTSKYERIRAELEESLMDISHSRNTIHARVDSVKRLNSLTVNCVKEPNLNQRCKTAEDSNRERRSLRTRSSVPNYIQRTNLIQRLTETQTKSKKKSLRNSLKLSDQ